MPKKPPDVIVDAEMIVQADGEIVLGQVGVIGLAGVGQQDARAGEAVIDIFGFGAPLRRELQLRADARGIAPAGEIRAVDDRVDRAADLRSAAELVCGLVARIGRAAGGVDQPIAICVAKTAAHRTDHLDLVDGLATVGVDMACALDVGEGDVGFGPGKPVVVEHPVVVRLQSPVDRPGLAVLR